MAFLNRGSSRIVLHALAANFFIIIVDGHDIGFLGLLEFYRVPYINNSAFTLNLNAKDNSLVNAACLFSAAGSILFLIGVFIRSIIGWAVTTLVAITTMWGGLFYLFINYAGGNGFAITIVTSAPFLAFSIILYINCVMVLFRSLKHNAG